MDLTMHDMAQTRPSVGQTIGAVLHLEGIAPTVAELRDYLASHLNRLPFLTHYLRGPGLKARWTHDAAPDLASRIHERRLDPGQDHLDAALQDLRTHPLPDQGPPWDLWLLHGHAPGRYTLCYRAHHSSHDGGGLRNILYTLFSTATDAPTFAEGPTPTAGLSAYKRTLRGMLHSAAANNIWNNPEHPLTGTRVSTWAQLPTDRLRAAATPRGGGSNDAILAALAGALRTWCAEHWPRGAGRPLPAVMMVDLRRAEEHDRPGNLFTFAPAPLPCHEPTPAGRLDEVIAATREAKNPAQRKAMRVLMDITPARAFHALATRLTTPARAIIDTSHLAIHQPLHYQEDRVTHVQPFTWLPHNHPASIAACSYNGTTSVYFVTDAALPGLHQLPALWLEAALELSVDPTRVEGCGPDPG
jgi:hypothetical protein